MHLFDLYRRLLVIVCTVYALVRAVQGINNLIGQLQGADARARLMRHYVMGLLASIRLRRFGWELLQIVVLAGVLIGLIYLHWRVMA